jgi:hypothetical protein
MLLHIGPNLRTLLRFRLGAGVWQLHLHIRASEEVEVVLWTGLAAFRVETVEAEKRERKAGSYVPRLDKRCVEYAYAKGKNFNLTCPSAPGGHWLVAIENLSGFETEMALNIWAEAR